MSRVIVQQITSRGDVAGQAFLNVYEYIGSLIVEGSLHERETYLLFALGGNEFHLVQFDRDTPQKEIAEFFDSRRQFCKIVKIEKGGNFTVSE